jgi:SAM-dependent methyltransferase
MKQAVRRWLRQTRLATDPFRDTIDAKIRETQAERGRQPTVLDVGCGNHSPSTFKASFDVHYVGVDIAEYNLDANDQAAADELIILNCSSEDYTSALSTALAGRRFDAITMRHVVEHLAQPVETVRVLAGLLDPTGVLFMSFPSRASATFPHGANSTLNFHDDPGHVWLPDVEVLTEELRRTCQIERVIERNRGGVGVGAASWLIALPTLAWARLTQRPAHVNGHTWRAVGFETVLIARRLVDHGQPHDAVVGR